MCILINFFPILDFIPFAAPVPFLLAQKTNPKKGTLPNAAARNPNAPLAGQRGSRTFLLASASHCALILPDN